LIFFVGVDIDISDEDGNTPLHIALLNAHAGCATALIEAGANMNAKNKAGRTPKDEARDKGMSGLLWKNGVRILRNKQWGL
jgi:ankyrin repeat protein